MGSIMADVQQTTEPTTDVALIQSPKPNVIDLTEEDVRSMVREAVKLAGGLESIVSDGDTVVLKPNFMMANHVAGSFLSVLWRLRDDNPHPEKTLLSQTANGIATDYRVAKAVAELVREINPTGKIYVMEASGAGYTAEKMELLGYNHENIPYVDEFISMDDSGRDYTPEGSDDLVAIDLGTKRLYDFKDGDLTHTGGVYYMDKVYYSADAIIDLPVLKNHQMAAVTGAIKNVAIGSTPPAIYGRNAGPSRMPIDHSWEPLNRFIHDYYLVRPVDFVVTDGLQALEHGPLAMGAKTLESVQMNMRLILAGKDALAVDVIHALVTGVDPDLVDYFTYLATDRVGIMDPARINVVGNVRVDEVRKPFKFPGFPYTWMNPEPRKRVYRDFDAPQVTIQHITLRDSTLTADLSSDKNLVKLEVFIDGSLAEVVRVCGCGMTLSLVSEHLSPHSIVDVYAYDKYLNCSETRVAVQ
jgi:uncharacterized protein (DUF362 family)